MVLALFLCIYLVSVGSQCPAGTCPSSDTCCDMGDGNYGCCPAQNAVCCAQSDYCCPQGTTCNLSAGTCVSYHESKFVPMIPTMVKGADPNCPADNCLTNQTCCSTAFPGIYGCCPFANAICCPDQQSCCPNDTECSDNGKCIHQSGEIQSAVSPNYVTKKEESKPGCSQGTCQSSETCCPIIGSQWGCCPYPGADCCSDLQHCCPEGYMCELSSGQCVIDYFGERRTVPMEKIDRPFPN